MTIAGRNRAISRRTVAAGLLAAAWLLAATGCGDDSVTRPGPSTETAFQGTVAGPMGESGFLEVTVDINTFEARGRMALGTGCEDQVTGTFNGATMTLVGAGDCGVYTLAGTAAGRRIEGTFEGPSGHVGSFVLQESSGAGSVTVYCGRWIEVAGGEPTGDEGPWDLVLTSSALSGVAYAANGEAIPLAGSRSDGHVTILHAATQEQIAQGDISGTEIAGTYGIGASAGTFAGQVCQ